MPILKVLIDEKGSVVGTALPDLDRSGTAGPVAVTLVARQGQRLLEIDVDEKVASLDPAKLHAAIKADYLGRKGRSGPTPITRKATRR